MTGATPTGHPLASTMDAADLVRRWEEQQAGYVPEREATFTLMLDIVSRLQVTPERLLDLGCGPGALARRAIAKWPSARVYGVDLDPVLLELGRKTSGDTIRWLESDLREPSWHSTLDDLPLDAVLSATALHWLDADRIHGLVRELAGILRPGGVFATYDTMPLADRNPRLSAITYELRDELAEAHIAEHGTERWNHWWQAARSESMLADQFAVRASRFTTDRRAKTATIAQFVRSLKEAGFQEAAPVKQVANRHLLVAIR